MSSINRREFLTLGGAAFTLAAAGAPALAAEPAPVVSPKGEPWADLPIRALLLSVPDRKEIDLFCAFVRDALPKLDPADAERIRARLAGVRRTAGAASTSRASEAAERFGAGLLGRPMPEPPLT